MADRLRRIAIVGVGGGIGQALLTAALARDETEFVLAASRAGDAVDDDRVQPVALDVTDEASVVAAAAAFTGELGSVIVATGTLHSERYQPEKSYRELDGAAMLRVLEINTVGPALVAKHFLPRLTREQATVFAALSARVGSIGDNRLGGWYSYRASKAALNMLIKSLAIEFGRRNRHGAVIGLHPGTVDTALSAPFQRNVPNGKLFDPAFAADRLLDVIARVSVGDSGGCFAWDGKPIEP